MPKIKVRLRQINYKKKTIKMTERSDIHSASGGSIVNSQFRLVRVGGNLI